MSWTDERVEKLKQLNAIGLSSSQIAMRIGGGVTRNAVIGKLHRLGICNVRRISRRRSNVSTLRGEVGYSGILSTSKTSSARTKAARVVHRDALSKMFGREPGKPVAAEPLPPPNPDDVPTKTFAEIENGDCRFIPGDPRSGGKMFCGHPVVPGTSWCAHHLQRVSAAPVTRAPFVPVRKVPADVTKAVDELLGDREHA